MRHRHPQGPAAPTSAGSLGTFLAVFLGVAFLSGTLVLGDTLRGELRQPVHRGERRHRRRRPQRHRARHRSGEHDSQRGSIDASLVDQRARRRRRRRGRARTIEGFGQLVGTDGDPLGGNGPPTLAGNWIDDRDLNPYRLVEGRAPARRRRGRDQPRRRRRRRPRASATRPRSQTPEPVDGHDRRHRHVRRLRTGSGRVTFTAFTLAERAGAPHPPAPTRSATHLGAGATRACRQDELVQPRCSECCPPASRRSPARSSPPRTRATSTSDFLDFFTTFLLVFAGIALLVATFSIYNTFSIIVAQRTRESALLRALGAGRRQVLRVGGRRGGARRRRRVGRSACVGGLGIAGLLQGHVRRVRLRPARRRPRASSVGGRDRRCVVGMRRHARRRRGARGARRRGSRRSRRCATCRVDRTGASSARGSIAGRRADRSSASAVVLGAVLSGDGSARARRASAPLLTLVGVVVLGPVVARPAAGVLGAPLRRLRGVTGALARRERHAQPAPHVGHRRRRSWSASPSSRCSRCFAASLKASIDDSVSQSFAGDLVIARAGFGGGGLSPQLATDVGRAARGATRDRARAGPRRDRRRRHQTSRSPTRPRSATGARPRTSPTGRCADLGATRSSPSPSRVADDNGWAVGDTVPVTFADGDDDRRSRSAPSTTSTEHRRATTCCRGRRGRRTPRSPSTPSCSIDLADGVSRRRRQGGGRARSPTRTARPTCRTATSTSRRVTPGVDMMLGDRLRAAGAGDHHRPHGHRQHAVAVGPRAHPGARPAAAVGQTRRQLRSMVRWESVIIAVFGTVGGLGARRVPRLGPGEGGVRGDGRHDRPDVLGAGRPARRAARGGRRRRRPRRPPSGAAGGEAPGPASRRRRVGATLGSSGPPVVAVPGRRGDVEGRVAVEEPDRREQEARSTRPA